MIMDQLTNDAYVFTPDFLQNFCNEHESPDHLMCLDTMRINVYGYVPGEFRYGAKKPDGLNDVSVWPGGFNFTLSSKILGKRYPERLNLDTLPLALEKCNVPGFRFDPVKVIRYGTCGRIDITDDTWLTLPIADYLLAVRTMPVPEKWIINRYKTAVTFKNMAKSFNQYLTFYSKEAEFVKNPIQGIEPSIFNQVLRVEHRITTGKKIQRTLGIKRHSIEEILTCDKSVNAELLDKWWHRYSICIDKTESFTDEMDRRAAFDLSRDCGGDPERIKARIRLKNKRPSYWEKKIFGILGAKRTDHDLVKEIIHALRN